MREGTTFTFPELQQKAVELIEQHGHTQSDIARALDVHRSVVSRALRDEDTRWGGTLVRIVEYLGRYRLEKLTRWKARRVDRSGWEQEHGY